jgi:hypothetical protein
MEGTAVSSSPSHCVIHSTEWLNSWRFTGCYAGTCLADSCDDERANVHRNTCCVWGRSFSQSHQYPKGRYVLWCRYRSLMLASVHEDCLMCVLSQDRIQLELIPIQNISKTFILILFFLLCPSLPAAHIHWVRSWYFVDISAFPIRIRMKHSGSTFILTLSYVCLNIPA